MNGIDYSRKLDLERTNYQLKANENTSQTEEYKKDLKESYDNRVDTLRENHSKNKNKLEANFKDSYDSLDRASKDSLLEKQLVFNKKLSEDKKEFNGIRKENHEDFNRRFKVLNDTHTSSFDEFKESSQKREKNLRQNFEDKIAFNEADKEARLAKFSDNNSDSSRQITEEYRLEKDQIIKDKDDAMHRLVIEEQDRRNFIKDTSVASIDKMKQDQEENLRKSRETANVRFSDLQGSMNKRVQDLDERNTSKVRELNERSKSDLTQASKQFEDRFAKQAYQNRQDLRELDFKNQANGVGEDSANFDILSKVRENEKVSEERRIDILKTQKENLEETYAKRETDATDRFQDDYRGMRIELSGELQKQEREMAEVNRTGRYNDMMDAAKTDDAHYRSQLQARNDSAQELGHTKKQARERYEKVTKDYAKKLEEVELFANARMDEFKKSTTKEKIEQTNTIEQRAREERSAERLLLGERFDKMENSYRRKIFDLETKNAETRMQYENKLEDLRRSTQDQITRTTKQITASTNNQLQLERENSKAKISQLKDALAVQRATSNKALNDIRLANVSSNNDLTYTYEQKLKNQEEKYKDIIDQTVRSADIDLDRLKLATAQEKEALMEQYEQKLERMESVNNQKLTNMEKYAGLQISQKSSSQLT